jgi:hypothetical protein
MAKRMEVNSQNANWAEEAVMGLRDTVEEFYRVVDALENVGDNHFADPKLAVAFRKNAVLLAGIAEAIGNRVDRFYKEGK